MENLNIRQFKLVSGETIIALISADNPSNYVIERPVIVYSNMMGGYQLADWFPFSKQKAYTINKIQITSKSNIQSQRWWFPNPAGCSIDFDLF